MNRTHTRPPFITIRLADGSGITISGPLASDFAKRTVPLAWSGKSRERIEREHLPLLAEALLARDLDEPVPPQID